MDNIELLAPAGSAESLVAGVQSGCDAVYMGGRLFSARQGADNFTYEKMRKYVEYCHLYGVKVHVAVNTLIKEKEINDLIEYIYEIQNAGVDAVIVQDIGAVDLFRTIAPTLPLHASTQMTVTNLDGVRFLEDMGFERVVLARELSNQNIEYICKNAKAEIEVFCHGAICMCYSGQCLMSSIIGGRSGNRGRCAQPCRLPYEMLENGISIAKGHLLSPKDLSLIDELGTLKRIGVSSLKIEGRLKRAEYVSAVVGIYRKYIDSDKGVDKCDKQELMNAFNRSGLTGGYFKGETGKQMMSFSNPSNVSENIFTDEAISRSREDTNLRKIKIKIKATLMQDDVLKIEISDFEGHIIFCKGTVKSEVATNRPLDEERLRQQLQKLGSTPFESVCTEVELGYGITIPISEINNVRRVACDMLVSERISIKKRVSCQIIKESIVREYDGKINLTAEVHTIEQAKACIDNGIETLYIPYKIADAVKKLSPNTKVVAKMPDIVRDDMKIENIENMDILIENFSQIKTYGGKRLYGDFRLNVYNSYASNTYKNLELVTVSPELNLKEIRQMSENTQCNLEIIGYGRLALMITQNCPIKATTGKCQNHKSIYTLKDRKNEEFPVLCMEGCVAKILNSKPIFMADKIEDIKNLKINSIRLIFTVENSEECDTIINVYNNALSGQKIQNPLGENLFTRGHYYRGVE